MIPSAVTVSKAEVDATVELVSILVAFELTVPLVVVELVATDRKELALVVILVEVPKFRDA